MDDDCDAVLPPTELDDDGDGQAECEGDCDDADATNFDGNLEVCDGGDNDCDAVIPSTELDDDGDGQAECEGDCDDADATNFDGNIEVCDGGDNDCDGLLGGDEIDDDSDGLTECAGDCDDAVATNYPGNTEVCDGGDNDCDAAIDEGDAWWHAAWPYRLPVTIAASSFDTDGPPVVLEVDFRAALDSLGDSSAFDPASLAVVLQDCSLGQPLLPAQFLDEWAGIFDKVDDADPAGNEYGSVAFLYDEDEEYGTRETLLAGSTVQVALYFGSASAPTTSNTTSATATASSLTSGASTASFDASAGGLLSGLITGGSPSLISQSTSCCGNSAYIGGWAQDPQDAPGTVVVLEDGPVFAAIEAFGSRSSGSGAYDYSYVYWGFAGHPALWSKVVQTTTASSTVTHSVDATEGIRPWESRQDTVSASASAVYTVDAVDFARADVSNGTWGVAWAYVQPPTFATNLTIYNPYLIVMGNDWADFGVGTPVTMPAGTAYFDHIVHLVLPHAGSWASVEDSVLGLLEGVSVSQGAAEEL